MNNNQIKKEDGGSPSSPNIQAVLLPHIINKDQAIELDADCSPFGSVRDEFLSDEIKQEEKNAETEGKYINTSKIIELEAKCSPSESVRDESLLSDEIKQKGKVAETKGKYINTSKIIELEAKCSPSENVRDASLLSDEIKQKEKVAETEEIYINTSKIIELEAKFSPSEGVRDESLLSDEIKQKQEVAETEEKYINTSKIIELEANCSPSESVGDESFLSDDIKQKETDTETEEKYINTSKIRLCGAGKKRFKWLLLQGHDPEEARKLAIKPVSERKTGSKSIFSGDSTQKCLETKQEQTSKKNEAQITELDLKAVDSFSENVLDKSSLSDEVQLNKKKLSGAARKRFKQLLLDGHDPEEARKLASKPRSVNISENEKGSKSICSGDSTQELALPKSDGPDIDAVKLSGQVRSKETIAQDKEKLSGAGRKRYKWLLQQGHDPEEAHKLAQRPMQERKRKIHSEDSTKECTLSKRAKIETDAKEATKQERPSGKNAPRTNRHDTESIRMAVCSATYPDSLLTADQLKAVQDCILNKIMKQKHGSIKPKFHGSSYKPGWLVLTCADMATAEWLKDIAAELRPWKGAALRVMEEREFHRPQIFLVYFPNSADDSNNKILEYVRAQNEDLNVAAWRILRRTELGKVTQLTLSVDQATVAKFKDQELKLSYKFGQVLLKPKGGLKNEESEAPKRLASRTEVTNRVASRTDALKRVTPRTEVPQRVTSRTEAPSRVASRTEASKRLASRTETSKRVASRMEEETPPWRLSRAPIKESLWSDDNAYKSRHQNSSEYRRRKLSPVPKYTPRTSTIRRNLPESSENRREERTIRSPPRGLNWDSKRLMNSENDGSYWLAATPYSVNYFSHH